MNTKSLILFLAFVFFATQVSAIPPPVPGAGVVERELEREYEGQPLEPEREIPPVQIDIPKEKLELPDGKKVFVREVVFKGNTSIRSEEIRCWVKNYLNRELFLGDIYELCELIDQGYAKKGYFLARAYPPPQKVESGVLVIEIIEGRLGNIRVVGNQYYTTRFICSYFACLQNKPLQYDEFVHALMLLNDNTDLLAGALFEKGEDFGCADVIIQVNDKRPINLYLNGNNYGRDLTTNVRAGGRLDWGNFFTQGDTLSVAQVVGFPIKDLYFSDVIYNIPLNRKGTSLEGAYLYSTFDIEELTSLRLKGKSAIGTLKVNQAVIRKRYLSLDVFSYFDYKQIQNFALGDRVSFDKLRVLTVGTLVDHFTHSQGRDYLLLRFAAGIPNFLGGLKAVDSKSSRQGGGGRFFIFTLDYDRIQLLPKDIFFYFHGTGQYSPNKLTLPEQIYIGGVDTVRGFPLAVGLGDSGYYFNFEFRFPPPGIANKCVFKFNKTWKEIVQFDAFLDHGGVFFNSGKDTFLWGTGLGVRIYGPWCLNLSIDVGFPLNNRDLSRTAFTYIKLTCQPF